MGNVNAERAHFKSMESVLPHLLLILDLHHILDLLLLHLHPVWILIAFGISYLELANV